MEHIHADAAGRADQGGIAIVREHADPRGRYVVDLDDGLMAELTYYDTPGVRVIDHTSTPEALRGTGIAGKLTARAIADAQEEGIKVDPVCSYTAAWLRRHPEFAEIVVDRPAEAF